jgi:hypothetical protein
MSSLCTGVSGPTSPAEQGGGMSIDFAFDTSFFTGGSSSTEVPGKYDVALAGRGYMLWQYPDTPYERRAAFTRQPIALLAPQQDTSGGFGERSLSNSELNRRSQDSWDHGAGQSFCDREDSDNRRFRSSKGVDVWERWALQLLPDTTQALISANTNLHLAVAGTRLYTLDGAAVRFSTDLTSWTPVTGLPGAGSSVATDGFNVWTAHSASGIYRTTRTTSAAASQTTGTVTTLGYAKGRLMAAAGPILYNITDLTGPTALPTALFTHPNTDWTWLGFASGQSGIYAGGYSGDKSSVYRVTIKADGTGLDVPTVAADLPDGEVLTSVDSYVGGVVLLGTSLGVRLALENSDGTLNIGGLIETGSPVLCFEGQRRFIWYGLSDYDTLSTGLGRLDPSVFTDPLTPAWASDLMVTAQGSVLSVVTFLDKRVFTVSGQGVFNETVNKVSVGSLDTGLITFGIPDRKVAMFVDVKTRSPVDTNIAWISVDSGAFTEIGSRSTTSNDPFPVGQRGGETFELRHQLLNADTDPAAGPVLTRWTLRAYPNPPQGEVITFAINLDENQLDVGEQSFDRNPQDEYALIRALQTSRQLVQLQIAGESITVLVDDHQWNATTRTRSGGWNGICDVSLKATAV